MCVCVCVPVCVCLCVCMCVWMREATSRRRYLYMLSWLAWNNAEFFTWILLNQDIQKTTPVIHFFLKNRLANKIASSFWQYLGLPYIKNVKLLMTVIQHMFLSVICDFCWVPYKVNFKIFLCVYVGTLSEFNRTRPCRGRQSTSRTERTYTSTQLKKTLQAAHQYFWWNLCQCVLTRSEVGHGSSGDKRKGMFQLTWKTFCNARRCVLWCVCQCA